MAILAAAIAFFGLITIAVMEVFYYDINGSYQGYSLLTVSNSMYVDYATFVSCMSNIVCIR